MGVLDDREFVAAPVLPNDSQQLAWAYLPNALKLERGGKTCSMPCADAAMSVDPLSVGFVRHMGIWFRPHH